MQLVITLRKEIADPAEGQALLDWTRLQLADHPEVVVSGHVTNHFAEATSPEPP